MGLAYMRAFPWIDVVVSGEADDVILPLFKSLLGTGTAPKIPGVYQRDAVGQIADGEKPHRLTFQGDLDSLPLPNYDDFFKRRAALKMDSAMMAVSVPFESSRGCWWGQKHHCTFCGLNGGGMSFRAKSARRIVDDIATLVQRHGVRRINAVDNIISVKSLEDFCNLLKDARCTAQIFYEVKANLKPSAIKAMAEAGITRVQPGIESLSDHVLSLMRKGITALQKF